jgi:hypothetical protein
VTASNRALIVLDILKGIIATIFGNIGLPPVVRYGIGVIDPAHQIPIIPQTFALPFICLIITIFTYHKIENKIIRALVVILLFVPILLMLLSYFSILKVPLPF